MRILVTGANGFIGQWLIPHLQQQGYSLYGLDVHERPQTPVDKWIQGDVRQVDDVQRAIRGCDAVVHLAVLPQYRSHDDPAADLLVNTLGTLQTLRAATAHGVQRFVFLSSSAVYGASGGRLREDASLQPLTPYGASKAAAEAYVGLFYRTHDLHTITLRLFNLYGRLRSGAARPTVESRFIAAVQRGEKPTIFGDPQRAFDFVHITDVLQAITLALSADVPAGSVCNIGSGTPTSLLQLARLCLQAAGRPHENPRVQEAPVAGPPSHWADITRARALLGYTPRQDLAAWISKQIAGKASP